MQLRSWLVLLAALLLTRPAAAEEVRVAVASNFAPALAALQTDFEVATGHRIRASAGSTGRHYAQILQGAPFDVFLAADASRPERLEAEGRIVPNSRQTYVLGQLVLWAPGAPDQVALEALLLSDPPVRLSIANPRLAPYGAAAEQWLRDTGAWSHFETRLVRGDNVAQAYQFVASGNAELGLLSLSQLRLAQQPIPGFWKVLPSDQHAPIEQQAVLLRPSPAGEALLAWLASPPVQQRLQEFGYDLP